MCRGDCQRNVESDDYKAYKEIEEQIGHCSPEQAWAILFLIILVVGTAVFWVSHQ